MNIPQSTIEPFGYTGVPHVFPRITSDDEARIRRCFDAIRETFKFTIERWKQVQRFRGSDIDLPMDLKELYALRIELAGGEEVHANFDELSKGFLLTITFKIPGSTRRYGEMLEYHNPDTTKYHTSKLK